MSNFKVLYYSIGYYFIKDIEKDENIKNKDGNVRVFTKKELLQYLEKEL